MFEYSREHFYSFHLAANFRKLMWDFTTDIAAIIILLTNLRHHFGEEKVTSFTVHIPVCILIIFTKLFRFIHKFQLRHKLFPLAHKSILITMRCHLIGECFSGSLQIIKSWNILTWRGYTRIIEFQLLCFISGSLWVLQKEIPTLWFWIFTGKKKQ